MNHRGPRKKERRRKTILLSVQRISNISRRRESDESLSLASLSRPFEPVTRASFPGAGHKSPKKFRKCRRYWQSGENRSLLRNRSIQRCRPRYQRPPSFSCCFLEISRLLGNRVFKSSLNCARLKKRRKIVPFPKIGDDLPRRFSGEFFKTIF